MDEVILGRTGLRVSVMGLGGGGHSRLGRRTGSSTAHSVAIVQRAMALGVNFIDTAEAYGTEEIVGEALRDVKRSDVVLSTKKSLTRDGRLISAAELATGLEASLRRLNTDHVDIYHLHGVQENQYAHAIHELAPAMLKLRDEGKIRFLGITEAFAADTGHAMLKRALQDEVWDVVMVGFNMLNQSARDRVLAETRRKNIGVLCMFAVRDALSRPEKLRETMDALVQQGLIDTAIINGQEPMAFLKGVAGDAGLPDLAYRFCRAEPGIHVVLSGTGNVQHLEQNAASILRPPLPEAVRQKLMELFARVDTVSGQ
jgi:aryl-alcohol dehydrogenase-like predicted oxidoreductase